MVMMMIIFIWGLSEATLFFIIPDVILSLHALRTKNFKYVLYANIVAMAGAMFGGIIIFLWSSFDAEYVEMIMLSIPATHEYMIEHVHHSMEDSTLTPLITGPIFGVPYVLSHYMFNKLSMRMKIIIWSVVWIIVYVIYFSIHSPF